MGYHAKRQGTSVCSGQQGTSKAENVQFDTCMYVSNDATMTINITVTKHNPWWAARVEPGQLRTGMPNMPITATNACAFNAQSVFGFEQSSRRMLHLNGAMRLQKRI